MSRTYLNNACQECDGTRSRVCGKLIFIVLTYMRIKHESFIQLQTPISAVVTGTWKFPLSTSCCLTNRRQLKGMLLSGLGATGVISSSRPVSSILCHPVFGREFYDTSANVTIISWPLPLFVLQRCGQSLAKTESPGLVSGKNLPSCQRRIDLRHDRRACFVQCSF